LGEASYALYLTHPFAIALARALINPAIHPWPFVPPALCLAINAASTVYVTFEKPLTRGLQRVVPAGA